MINHPTKHSNTTTFGQYLKNRQAWWFLSLLTVVFMLSGCEEKQATGFTAIIFKNYVKQKELGRCENEPGTLVEAYHPWWPTRIADAIFITPKQEGSPVKHCIPDIDPNIAAALTPEQKMRNRAKFYNAMTKTINQKIFTKTNGQEIMINKAFLELQELARQGEELAQIELNLTDYYSGPVQRYHFNEDNKHYQRLKQLAERGDGDAMCLFAQRHPTPFNGYEHLKHGAPGYKYEWYHQAPEDKFGKGIEKAAKHGGMECMVIYSLMLSPEASSVVTVQPDRKRAFQYLIEAGKMGSERATALLRYAYMTKNNRYGIQPNLGKAECWLEINNSLFPDYQYSLEGIQRRASKQGIDISKPYPKYDPKTFCEAELRVGN